MPRKPVAELCIANQPPDTRRFDAERHRDGSDRCRLKTPRIAARGSVSVA